jgi:clan AA aspartic protease
MILGKIVEGRVVLPVSFCLSQTTELAIDFVVDTGFNGYLTLPSPAVAALKLPLESTIVARLADGSESEIPIYLAEIRWNEQVQFVTVLATGTKPLLGTSLLQGFRLTIEFSADGIVQVERI